MAKTETAGTGGDFMISRVFAAPRELVWKAFTEPDRMQHWWGPKGFTVVASKMDLRPGGTYHYGLRSPTGVPMWGMFRFREVTPPERLVFINSFSDEKGGITRHPLSPSWPLEMLSTVTFEEHAEGTKLTVRWTVTDAATVEERKTFDSSHDSMRGGWGGTFDQLADYLAGKRLG